MVTKAEQKRLEVLENKKSAYVKKVKGLLGHVFSGLYPAQIVTAFEGGVSAEEFATSIAAKEAVGACIQPMKADALNATEKKVRERFARLLKVLEENGGNLYTAFPFSYSDYSDDGKAARARHEQVRSITINTQELIEVRAYHEQNFKRMPSEAGIERAVQNARDIAAAQYDAFICKMVGKVGKVDGACIDGNHVWGNSVLTVTKGLKTERWHTQMILNFSKFGLPFNQFPSRLKK